MENTEKIDKTEDSSPIQENISEAEKQFKSVDISEFIDPEENRKKEEDTGIIVFTQKQSILVEEIGQRIARYYPQHKEIFEKRIADLKHLAASIANFPSLLSRATLTSEVRTPEALIERLISNDNNYGNTLLQIPSKATLGKGFLVAKLHTFSSLSKLAVKIGQEFEKTESLEKEFSKNNLIQAFKEETNSMMFLFLAEDVYLNLIKDQSLSVAFRRQLATSLLLLWEHRAYQNISDISPVLTKVWKARSRLAPAFGTMMGTSELVTFSCEMDSTWLDFIKSQLENIEVTQAMEEFLFGISYEQILHLKRLLREKGINSIGRNEVSKFLGENIQTDVSGDYKDFYMQYSIRRDNAKARKRLNLPGPHKTLEDHFIKFVMEEDRRKQDNDAFAK